MAITPWLLGPYFHHHFHLWNKKKIVCYTLIIAPLAAGVETNHQPMDTHAYT